MQGGEIFIPKIPSIKIVDLAKAMAPSIPHEIIGIRPGEKLHEVMCPKDDSHLTIEFSDHYIIAPSINFWDQDLNFKRNALKEEGKFVEEFFEYSSGDNVDFLKSEQILEFNKE